MTSVVKRSIPSVRTFSAQAAAAATPQQTSYSLPYHQPQVTKLPTGGVVASLENNSPIATVSVLFKAGSRYESGFPAGVSHVLRSTAGLATKNHSAFKITRQIQQLGGSLSAENGREHISYTINVNRDCLDICLELLNSVTGEPVFREWEVKDRLSAVNIELGLRSSMTFSLDLLHRAAFRAALGNSIFVPSFNIPSASTADNLLGFHSATHTADRMAISGLGVEHSTLLDFAKSLKVGTAEKAVNVPSPFKGGDERIHTGGDAVDVAVAGSGVKIGSSESASLAVAQFLLGAGPSIKYGDAANTRLVSLIRQAGGNGRASAINCNYSDGGLFGFHIRESADKAGAVCQAIVKDLKASKFSAEEVNQAKNRAKAAVSMGLESQATGVEDMGLQALFTGNYLGQKDITAALDKVDSASIQKAISKSFGGKLAVGAVGNVSNIPYADEL